MTAFIVASLLAASRLIYLLIDIEEDLREITGILKDKK
jgi:hypothetical protein